ncbi:DUF2218 domain-containing protein [Microvirga thermotolerans]|uniref:DUF2218 domain-containing protein n=1 Tax=Microvirga thermotolerans TaxID=2651334 RepID=A0A5P9JZ71_9HYPH|nr:DUF2218 domain-containing protein [Microvirga thermotolerans]QFU17743.1 DUF2218 domain-containing protein [Microvirga thermotolerans]
MPALRSEASIGTELPDRYLVQLCKQFALSNPATYSDTRGRAEFGFGHCTLQASSRYLTLVVEAEDEQSLARMQHLIGLKVERCMWREQPVIKWVRST